MCLGRLVKILKGESFILCLEICQKSLRAKQEPALRSKMASMLRERPLRAAAPPASPRQVCPSSSPSEVQMLSSAASFLQQTVQPRP